MRRLPEIIALEERRRYLAEESDLHRQTLVLHYRDIEASTEWMRRAWGIKQILSPVLTSLASLHLVLFGRKTGVARPLAAKVILGVQVARSLTSLWRTFSQRRAS